MRKLLCLAGAIALAAFATQAQAQVIFTQGAATGPIASPGQVSFNFNSTGGAGNAAFDINGYLSLDGFGNCCTDIFTLYLNAAPVYSGSVDLGGGGTSTDLFNPFGATFTATPFGAPPPGQPSYIGGLASLFVPLAFLNGPNTLTFDYTGDFQGLGDEAWGIDKLVVTQTSREVGGVPEPAAWALMLLGFGFVGGALRTAKRRQEPTVSYA
jgi:hypothetical protein